LRQSLFPGIFSGAARVAVDLKRASASIGLVNSDVIQKLRAAVRDVPDFPKKGIIFKDITPILKDGPLFRAAIDLFLERFRGKRIDKSLASVLCR